MVAAACSPVKKVWPRSSSVTTEATNTVNSSLVAGGDLDYNALSASIVRCDLDPKPVVDGFRLRHMAVAGRLDRIRVDAGQPTYDLMSFRAKRAWKSLPGNP